MIWDGFFTNESSEKQVRPILIGNILKPIPFISRLRLLAKMDKMNSAQILLFLSMVYLFLISKSNNPMLSVMERQGFSQNKTEPDTVLKTVSFVALIISPSWLPYLITCLTSVDKGNKNKVLTTVQTPIQKPSLMPLRKKEKKIFFIHLTL